VTTQNEFFIDNAIDNLIEDFCMYPNKYLTEEDVRTHLCLNLMERFGVIQKTKDSDRSIALHTEVRWWGPNGSQERSDIVIFDVSELSVTKEVIKKQTKMKIIPQKGYSFNKALAIIEIKLRHTVDCSDNQYIKKIKKDINKLTNIKQMFNDFYDSAPVLSMVALDKRNLIPYLANCTENIGVKFKYAYKTKYT